jgi:hypothetical protein
MGQPPVTSSSFKDWNGTPEPGVGEGIKAHLHSVTP